MEKMYTAQEVADYLKIKKTTVYELIKRENCLPSKSENSSGSARHS